MDGVLKSGYYESPPGYDNVDWFVDEISRSENKMASCFKNFNKDIVMTRENEEHYRKNNICRFCESN